MPDEVKKEDEEINETDAAAIAEAAEKVATEKGLETKVKDKMAAIFDSADDDIEEENTENTEDTEEESTEKKDDEIDEDKDTDSDKENKDDEVTDDATSEGEKKTDDETLTLLASHIQTAVRLGMSEDKVKEHFDKNPEAMISLLAELHKGENGLSARYAQMGRAIQQKQIADQKTTVDEDTSSESLVDLKKLRARFDDDDEEAAALIDGVIKPLSDALVKMQKQMDQRVQPNDQTAYSQQEDRAVQSEVNNFFDNDQLKEFRDYYGTVKPGEDPRVALTGAQFQHRGEVCKEGSSIRIGADFSGEKLTVSDVLQRAHLQLTEPMREEMIREEISSKIKKRAKGLSVKAGTKKVPKTPSSGDATKQLELTTKARLKKVFG